jgi:Secretion system C-terminal sorting domain
MTTSLKQLIVVAVTFAATTVSFAQTFSITPNDTIQLVGVLDDLQTLSIQQPNISSGNITLQWEKVSETVPLLWEASVCDNSICNTSLVNSGTMNPILPTEYGLLLVHITPHVNYGTAIVRYAVWDSTNVLLKDTLTYILSVNATAGIEEMVSQNNFNVYNNPAADNICISSTTPTPFQFLISDNAGKVLSKGVSRTNTIFVSTQYFANGVYHISLFNENKNSQTKKIIVLH